MDSTATAAGFDTAHARVCELCDHFERRIAEIKSPDYKEAVARVEFITPFFKALGWDVDNAQHRSIYEKDCVIEKAEQVEGSARSADYAFRRPGTHLFAFYVEAKKPSADIRNHTDCHQAVRYGWNAGTPLVVLTDFEQLLILDSRARPDRHDATRHVLKANGSHRFTDYRDPQKFAEIWGLFGRHAVSEGALDAAAAALPKLSGRIQVDEHFARGTRPVDEEFLAQMELWRERLAKSLKKTNPALGSERLTSLTQRILDRLVFLRFLEDRAIERDITFRQLAGASSAWDAFRKVSRRLDARYNGIIYKKDGDGIEDDKLAVDDTAFGKILTELAPGETDYLFAAIPVTILGSIYERFLGNVIVATDKTARVEPKPEVRKAGGVYYTPDYIVRHIVAETVGRCIAGKKPADIAHMRFADIACGSGSFLVEVFACLIRHHLRWYLDDKPEAWVKKGILRRRERDGDLVLTLREKRRILCDCVFGVDLDPSATEVTHLSLYLRLLEDESFPSTQMLFDEEHRALLPDLRPNILCGNSLIESDIADLFGLAPDDEAKIRPLDFRGRFPQVFRKQKATETSPVRESSDDYILIGADPTHGSMDREVNYAGEKRKRKGAPTGVIERRGGFDAIVGNPPYIRNQTLREIVPLTPKYCREHYVSAQSGSYDIYVVFIERAAQLLADGGQMGMIVPNKFLRTGYGAPLREWLAKNALVRRIVDFGDGQVFPVTIYTCLLFLDAAGASAMEHAEASPRQDSFVHGPFSTHSVSKLTAEPWTFSDDAATRLLGKLKAISTPLLGLGIEMNRGSSTGDDDVFLVPPGTDIEPGATRIAIHATDFNRYRFTPNMGKRVIFPYDMANGGRLYVEKDFARLFPKACDYLAARKTALKQRKGFKAWYGFSAARSITAFDSARVVVPLLANRGLCALIPGDLTGKLCIMAGGGFALSFPDGTPDARYVLGLVNSKLLFWQLRQSSNFFRGGWITCTKQYFGDLLIRNINPENESLTDCRDQIISFVDKITRAADAERKASDPTKREYWRQHILVLERQIDALTYELYGLTDEEIALVEAAD